MQEDAAISIFYWNDTGSPFKTDFDGIESAGGIQVSVNFYPPGTHIPWSNTSIEHQPVVVRGHPARLWELRKGVNSNVDWRTVRWELPVKGGTIQWHVSNHPDRYTREETLTFIEELRAV